MIAERARGRGGRHGGRVGAILPEGAPASVIATIGETVATMTHLRGGRIGQGNRGFRGRRASFGGISFTKARPQTSNAAYWTVAYSRVRNSFSTIEAARAAFARYRAGECPCCGRHPAVVSGDDADHADDEATETEEEESKFNPAVFHDAPVNEIPYNYFDSDHDDDHAAPGITV